MDDNPSKDLPYHNNAHMYGTACVAFQLVSDMRASHRNTTTLNTNELKALLHAALLHDYGHSGGSMDDAWNIENAVKHAEKTVPYPLQRIVIPAIRCTKFPFVVEPTNVVERILRDADILYATVTGDAAIIMEGLRAEINVKRGRGNKLSYTEMVEAQIKFLSEVKFYTKEGKMMMDRYKDEFVSLLQKYASERV